MSRPLYLLLLAILFLSKCCFGETTNKNAYFDTLIMYSQKPNIAKNEFGKCVKYVNMLLDSNITELVIIKDSTLFEQYTLTSLFGNICVKLNTIRSIRAFMGYLKKNEFSPEEQLSYSFQEIFWANPDIVLTEIETFKKEERKLYLERISYGFLNYDPKEMSDIKRNPTDEYCKKKLFKKYPIIKKIYKKHKKSLDYIIKSAKETL